MRPRPSLHSAPRPLRWLLLALMGAILMGGCGRSLSWPQYLSRHEDALTIPKNAQAPWQTFTVRPGQIASAIARDLEWVGIIDDPRLFEAYVRVHGLDTSLEAGQYELCACQTLIEVVEALQFGRMPGNQLLIPEGLRLEEMAERLAQMDADQAAVYLELTNSPAAVRQWQGQFPFLQTDPPLASLEGYLFPSTYELPSEGNIAHFLVRSQLREFERRLYPLYVQQAPHPRTLTESLVLASIIAREAVHPADLARVSGVMVNRLEQAMMLQMDSTVQYALGYDDRTRRWWREPSYPDDFQIDSPYNTYRHAGLPPGPIANPGQATFAAALAPEAHPYLYFVTNPDGSNTLLFAATFEEHRANAEAWRD